MVVTANMVKQRGVSFFDEILESIDQFVISLRGKKKYVVMNMDRYKELRAKELDMAYLGAMEDIKNGNYHTDVDKHLRDLEMEINS